MPIITFATLGIFCARSIVLRLINFNVHVMEKLNYFDKNDI